MPSWTARLPTAYDRARDLLRPAAQVGATRRPRLTSRRQAPASEASHRALRERRGRQRATVLARLPTDSDESLRFSAVSDRTLAIYRKEVRALRDWSRRY